MACCLTSSAQAANLGIEDLLIHYQTQSPAAATGTIQFNIRFLNPGGDATNGYDLFMTQLMIDRPNPGAVLTLDLPATADTAAIGLDYWLPAPTGNEQAVAMGSEFCFEDFVPIGQARMPAAGAILAHYLFDFTVSLPEQFGVYFVQAGNLTRNKFSRDLGYAYPNTTTPATFTLTPEPAAGVVLTVLGLLRRRGTFYFSGSPPN
jgi:hypothetical protein